MNVRVFNSLQTKLTLAFLAVSLMPLGVMGIFSVQTADRVIQSIATNQLENVAAEKQALLERWITERKADLAVVANCSLVRGFDASAIGPYLKLVQNQYQVYDRFVVADRTGTLIFDTKGLSGDSYSNAPWFQQAMEGRPYISDVYVREGLAESVFQLSVPIQDEQGQPQGAVCATVCTAAILASVLQVSLGATGECYLVDRSGTFLAHQDPKRILKDTIARSGSFDRIFQSDGQQPIYTDYRGIAVLGASRSIAGTPWYVVVEQDRDEAFGPSRGLKHLIYLAIAVTFVGAVGLSVVLAYYVSAPIRKLSAVTNALARGDFDNALLSSRTGRHDEIGALYADFERMAGQLRDRHHLLERRVGLTETELRKADARLEVTMQAAARSENLAALGRLASGVAHEVRTPLTSLKLFLEGVEADLAKTTEHREDFEIAMRQVNRIEATINHFLDFARPRDPVLAEIDLPKLVQDALVVVRPRANHQEVQVDVVVVPPLPCVKGDARQLGEALVNLLVNGLDATSAGGRLKIVVRASEGHEGQRQSGVLIDVSDTGSGIEESDLDRLFEPFFTTKASGSGLGLPIVQGTVQRHGGDLKVTTRLGHGTTFSIFLPASHT